MRSFCQFSNKSAPHAIKGVIFFFIVLVITLNKNIVMGQTNSPLLNAVTPKSWAININASPTLSFLICDEFSDSSKGAYGFVGGLNLAYYLKKKSRFNVAFSIGLTYSSYNAHYGTSYKDSVLTTDYDNDIVHIFDQYDNLNQTLNVSYFDIPLSLHLDFILSSRIVAFVNVGYSFSIATINNSYSVDLILTRKGYYPEYNVLIYEVDVTDSPYFYPTNKSMSGEGVFDVKNNANLFSVIGIRYKLSSSLGVSLGFNSIIGVKNISNNMKNHNSTLINNDYTINSIFDNSELFKVNAHGILLGINMFF